MPAFESLRHLSRHRFLRYCAEATAVALLPDFLRSGEIPEPKPILSVDTDKPYVAVTLDDGYKPDNVRYFLRIAKALRTKFTVFPIGEVMTKSPDLWREVHDAGHEIGNHSHSHIDIRDKSKKEIQRDFERFETEDYPEVIGKAFPEPGLARVPLAQGPVNLDVQRVIYGLNDFHVHWRVDSYSWKKGGLYSKANFKFVMERMQEIKQGDIIILHFTQLDLYCLPAIFRLIKLKGLTNVTFSKLWQSRKQ